MRRISAKPVAVAIAILLCLHKSGLGARAVGPGDDPRVAQRTVLSGRVIDLATNEPIAGASVSLTIRGQQTTTAIADENGAFAFALSIDDGVSLSGMIRAQKAGYAWPLTAAGVPQALTVAISGGKPIPAVTLTLTRGAVLAGTVVDARGKPLPRASVRAVRMTNARLVPGGGATTDDLGAFRIAGLAPGDYQLVAAPPPPPTLATQPQKETTMAPTFYPNAIDAAGAGTLKLTAGELTGLLISMRTQEAYSISGVFVDSQGRPVQRALITLAMINGAILFGGVGHAQTAADGSFVLTNIPPGPYQVHGMVPPSRSGSAAEQAQLSITVEHENISGVRLVAKPRLN